MRRFIAYLMLYLWGCSFSVAQGFCKEAVRRAYEKVYKSKDDRVKVDLGTYRRKSLCFGKTKGEIYSAIRNGSVFNYGGALYNKINSISPTKWDMYGIKPSNFSR